MSTSDEEDNDSDDGDELQDEVDSDGEVKEKP
jgi:Rubisco LSMT substrate-binding